MVYISQTMRLLLFPLYLLYRTGSRIKDCLYRCRVFKSIQAPLPIISVGNISFGGTHKTPLAMHLLAFLKEQGCTPALISRGYRGKWEKRGGILSDGKAIFGNWQDSGDEPFMVAQNMPGIGVFIGKNRLLSCVKAKDLGFDVAVLDDGFQHRRLEKDVDIVLYSPEEKVALRESSAALNRAQILLVEGPLPSLQKKRIHKKAAQSKVFSYSVLSQGIFKTGNKDRPFPDEGRGIKVMAFSGIARPERFVSLLKEHGIKPSTVLKFPDHHSYPHSSVRKILEEFRASQADVLITTEKDFVKCRDIPEFYNLPVYYLKIDLEIDEDFYREILVSLENIKRQN